MTHKKNSRRYGSYLRLFFSLSDLLLFNLGFALTLLLARHIVETDDIRMLWILVNVSFLAILIRTREEKLRDRTILLDRVTASSLINIGLHALFFLSLSELLSRTSVPLSLYVIYYGIMIVILPVWNIAVRRAVKAYRRRGFNFIRVIIVGTNSNAQRLCQELESDPGFGYRVLGFFDDTISQSFYMTDRYLGHIDDLPQFAVKNLVDQIYYTLPEPESGIMQKVVKTADDTCAEFFYVPAADPTLGRNYTLHSIGSMPVLAGRRNPLKNPFNATVKRSFDFILSSFFLVTVYPFIYIPIAIAIKLTSPGPIYFRQKRTGYEGNSFDCLKFRTMRVNKDADTCQATPNDKRKTPLGNFLRKTSLDELPQFINVWKGDMSIVGPRPHMLKHTEDYSKLIDRYMARHLVKPGITGWAQVNGYRGVTDQLWKMEKRVEYDVWYIEHWTFLLDLKIMVRTVLNVFQGEKNAY